MTPNVAAFLSTIAHGEGVNGVLDAAGNPVDPYRVCYAKRHVIQDMTYHPHQLRPNGTREWAGEKLTDAQCAGAGLHPGCVSTAAGRYQLTWGTFERLQDILRVPDFTPGSQDDCAVQLLKEVGALDFINAGDFGRAVPLCAHLWASFPGNTAGQPQRSFAELARAYSDAGGMFA
jgi:lysozyme